MHEHSLMKDLLGKIHQLSRIEKKPLMAVNIQLGELAHISSSHLREHFEHEVSGTALQGVMLNIEELVGIDHPQAQDIVLQSLEFEDNGD
ncbi:hydrogenase/urease maturation nickel metallochaperone HypA [Neptunomonas antarctica]|uniref:Hydrogenase nickel incorporation protein HypA/HybF n=1 Tax=Neptunomonas antarctica TaxID=619304 RepID=A0A1N7L483_9GAMM|nr:hydrogenase/urease maturation nickel metallochaperone HypA [Neptunomonas antarctica]SIS68613.1 hydrogenase nickel incorporation protein HypA/HybF [Neptunomonas antarctica]